jgi:coenzyme PQQ synthesis protein D (PqqD)
MSVRYRYARHIAWQIVGGEVIIVDVASGKSFGLNRSASFIFTSIGESPADEIAGRFAERFRVNGAAAQADVSLFIEDMLRRNVIEGAA